jgi:PIN domain nuclease of toxin-antitoxin system
MGNEPVKVLLDTHVWIWAAEGSKALGVKSRRLLTNRDTQRYVSPVSTLEIARLVARREILLACPLSEWVSRSMALLKLQTLELDHATAMDAYALPGDFHADPADRQLVATSRVHGLRLLTADARILAYRQVHSLPAGN